MRHCSRIPAFIAIFCAFLTFAQILRAGQSATQTPDARMLRFPDVSADSIVFVYAGDIWTVARQGGLARRISSPQGKEVFPKFSPDGKSIAFSGNYDGNTDVYIMPSEGGIPKRLTHHSSVDHVVDFHPDGSKLLIRSRMAAPSSRFNQLFLISIDGGLPEPLPFLYGELAAFSPDGKQMALQLVSCEFRTWKRYRGGMASDIWLYDTEQNTSRKMTNFAGTDALPMWHGDDVYFLSDRDSKKKLNIWAYSLKTKKTRQVTQFTDYDVKWPSIGPDAIVFEQAGRLHLLDLATERAMPVEIRVPDDLPQFRSSLKNVSDRIENFDISPTGQRGLFEARGEVFTIPARHGSIRNLTNTSGAAERFAVWSPDAANVAYFSDATGEYELYIRPSDGSGQAVQITRNGKVFRYRPVWSPDNKIIAFSDKTGSLWVVAAEAGSDPQLVDKDEWTDMESYNWSPDSRYLAYHRHMANRNAAIMVYDTLDKRVHQVTGDYYDDTEPVFDQGGDYLFFRSNRSFTPVFGDFDETWVYANSARLYAVTLRKTVESPIAPRSDEETADGRSDDANDAASNGAKREANANGSATSDAIDFDDIERRVVELPVDAGNLRKLRTVEGKLVFLRRPPAGAAKNGQTVLTYYDTDSRKEETVMADVDDYEVSCAGNKFIYKSGSTYGIASLAKNGGNNNTHKLATSDLEAWIEPRAEWTQLFNEAWRIERDFFYDPNMHGLNWENVRARYAAMLPFVVDREDLNYVIGEMIGELNASHAYVRGGDVEKGPTVSVGLLGCDFVFDRSLGLFQFSRIYEGAVWDATQRSPLVRPGIDVKHGDYLMAVNGMKVDSTKDPWAALQGLAGKTVTLEIGSPPDAGNPRRIIIEPLSSETDLRAAAWIEANRLKVQQATGNRVGYIYVPDTGRNGLSELFRQFAAQWHKDALIIDERFNAGGQVPDRFVELLNRPTYNYWARRDHRDWRTPNLSHTGPKVMLINGWSGSGGDALPYYFRKAALGPLVGTRTWGGLIGISGNPKFIDGGYISAPAFGFWNTAGNWEVEGYGVDPDYEVEPMPHDLAQGADPQLDKAIEVVLDMLKKTPPTTPAKPVYPDRSDTK